MIVLFDDIDVVRLYSSVKISVIIISFLSNKAALVLKRHFNHKIPSKRQNNKMPFRVEFVLAVSTVKVRFHKSVSGVIKFSICENCS